jgi:hypothetical protein
MSRENPSSSTLELDFLSVSGLPMSRENVMQNGEIAKMHNSILFICLRHSQIPHFCGISQIYFSISDWLSQGKTVEEAAAKLVSALPMSRENKFWQFRHYL